MYLSQPFGPYSGFRVVLNILGDTIDLDLSSDMVTNRRGTNEDYPVNVGWVKLDEFRIIPPWPHQPLQQLHQSSRKLYVTPRHQSRENLFDIYPPSLISDQFDIWGWDRWQGSSSTLMVNSTPAPVKTLCRCKMRVLYHCDLEMQKCGESVYQRSWWVCVHLQQMGCVLFYYDAARPVANNPAYPCMFVFFVTLNQTLTLDTGTYQTGPGSYAWPGLWYLLLGRLLMCLNLTIRTTKFQSYYISNFWAVRD